MDSGDNSKERQQEEEALPARAHGELLVRTVAVQEERLAEDREQPMRDEEGQDDEHGGLQGPGEGNTDRPQMGFDYATCIGSGCHMGFVIVL